ncbi:MAG: hypothetical protein RIC87_19540 [Kiloniellales bacterium]
MPSVRLILPLDSSEKTRLGGKTTAQIFGSAGESNLLTGTDLDDQIYGQSGSDTLYGLTGNDSLFRGSGFDDARQIQVDRDGGGDTVDQAVLVDGVSAASLMPATDFLWLT